MKALLVSLTFISLNIYAGCATNPRNGIIYCGPGDCSVNTNTDAVYCSKYKGGGAATHGNGNVYCGTGNNETSATVSPGHCIPGK